MNMTPNIYLDIVGVLLANDQYVAASTKEFLKYVLTNYPDTTTIMTTPPLLFVKGFQSV